MQTDKIYKNTQQYKGGMFVLWFDSQISAVQRVLGLPPHEQVR